MWRFVLLWGLDPCISHSVISPWLCILPPQDQLSADMYSFVAKEIDYANYFQTVRVHEGETAYSPFARVLVQTGRSVGVRLRPRDWACDGKERDVTVLPVKKPCLFFLLVWIPLPHPSPKTLKITSFMKVIATQRPMQWLPGRGGFAASSRRHLAMAGDIFSCHLWGRCYWHLVGRGRGYC